MLVRKPWGEIISLRGRGVVGGIWSRFYLLDVCSGCDCDFLPRCVYVCLNVRGFECRSFWCLAGRDRSNQGVRGGRGGVSVCGQNEVARGYGWVEIPVTDG